MKKRKAAACIRAYSGAGAEVCSFALSQPVSLLAADFRGSLRKSKPRVS